MNRLGGAARYAVVVAIALAGIATPAAAGSGGQALSGFQRATAELPALQAMVANHAVPTHLTANATPPAGSISPNITFLSNLPLPSAISIGFIGNTAFVSTVVGLYSVDITDPTNPALLGSVPMYIWENEHMQVIPDKNLVIISRDPRGYTSPGTTIFPYGTVQIFDVSNPQAMVEIGTHFQPTGHTAACINDCSYLWVAGPAAPCLSGLCIDSPGVPGLLAPGPNPTWPGRPVWAVDITNPSSPKDCANAHFIDTNSHLGKTDYDHDADVDRSGVAWVAGSGHIRGYWTSGQHFNYADGKMETATPCDPIEYAGANMVQGQFKDGGDMHNTGRNLGVSVDGRRGDVLAATEENTTTTCSQSGKFWTYDIGPTKGAAAQNPNLMYPVLDSWGTLHQNGTAQSDGSNVAGQQVGAITGCDSAHWFTDRGDGLIAIAFYSQGTRLLDIRDPRHITQVGWYNVQNTNTWAAYWHGDNYIYVADFERGLDVLRYHGTNASGTIGGEGTTSSAPAPGAVAGGSSQPTPNTSAARTPLPAAPLAPLGLGLVAALVLTRRRVAGRKGTQTRT